MPKTKTNKSGKIVADLLAAGWKKVDGNTIRQTIPAKKGGFRTVLFVFTKKDNQGGVFVIEGKVNPPTSATTVDHDLRYEEEHSGHWRIVYD